MQIAEKKKKIVLLVAYAFAVVCLLAGLFLPLFNGKDILALKLGDIFKSLLGKAEDPNPFALCYRISLFGIEKLTFDFTALTLTLYAAVTALAVLSFIPVVLSVRKEGKLAKGIYYGFEIAAVIVLALYFTTAVYMMSIKNSLFNDKFVNAGYSMLIAMCGTALALFVLCGMDKGKKSIVKIVLAILSAIGFLALFDLALVSAKMAEPLNGKLSPALVGSETNNTSGTDYLTFLFAEKISDVLAPCTETKQKMLIVFGAIVATLVLINFFIDTIKLATGKDKKPVLVFDIARYGLELIAAACVLIMALVCKETMGIMLIAILAVAAVRLATSIVRFVTAVVKKAENTESEGAEETAEEIHEEPVGETEVIPVEAAEETETETVTVTPPPTVDDGYKAPDDDDYSEEEEYTAPTVDDEDYKVPTEEDGVQPVEESVNAEEPSEASDSDGYEAPGDEDENDYVVEEQKEYIDEPETVEEPAEPVEDKTEEAVEEVEEKAEEPAAEEEAVEEPVPEEVTPVETVEEPEEVEEPKDTEDGLEEAVKPPYREEIKPYNPYERHSNNPFRNYEQTAQPYNPYAPVKQTTQPAYERPQPTRRVYEPKPVTPKPVERPQGVRPLQPRPIIQEFKPVPPISEQPPREKNVYTIDTIYAGPTDDFIRKLSNDERIEFAKTFIEKNRGNLGNIPDYVVGGDNKKFFSVAFIYLGRIRGLVSDGLLNKMYKELNML